MSRWKPLLFLFTLGLAAASASTGYSVESNVDSFRLRLDALGANSTTITVRKLSDDDLELQLHSKIVIKLSTLEDLGIKVMLLLGNINEQTHLVPGKTIAAVFKLWDVMKVMGLDNAMQLLDYIREHPQATREALRESRYLFSLLQDYTSLPTEERKPKILKKEKIFVEPVSKSKPYLLYYNPKNGSRTVRQVPLRTQATFKQLPWACDFAYRQLICYGQWFRSTPIKNYIPSRDEVCLRTEANQTKICYYSVHNESQAIGQETVGQILQPDWAYHELPEHPTIRFLYYLGGYNVDPKYKDIFAEESESEGISESTNKTQPLKLNLNLKKAQTAKSPKLSSEFGSTMSTPVSNLKLTTRAPKNTPTTTEFSILNFGNHKPITLPAFTDEIIPHIFSPISAHSGAAPSIGRRFVLKIEKSLAKSNSVPSPAISEGKPQIDREVSSPASASKAEQKQTETSKKHTNPPFEHLKETFNKVILPGESLAVGGTDFEFTYPFSFSVQFNRTQCLERLRATKVNNTGIGNLSLRSNGFPYSYFIVVPQLSLLEHGKDKLTLYSDEHRADGYPSHRDANTLYEVKFVDESTVFVNGKEFRLSNPWHKNQVNFRAFLWRYADIDCDVELSFAPKQ